MKGGPSHERATAENSMSKIGIGNSTFVNAVEKIPVAVNSGKNVRVKLSVLGKSKRKAAGSYASLEAYDGTTCQVATYFFAKIEEEKDLAINLDGKDLINTVKVLSKTGKDFELEIDGNTLILKCGSDEVRKPLFSECNLIGIDQNDATYAQITVKKDELFSALGRGGYAFGANATLSGVYLECYAGEISIYSTDGIRIAKAVCGYKEDKVTEGADLAAYVPITVLKSDIFSDEMINICFSKNKIVLRDKATFIILNRIVEKFPIDGIKMMKVEAKATLNIPKKSMLNAIEIVSLSEEVKDNPVIISKEDEKLYLVTINGGAKATLEGTCSGELGELCINMGLLKEAFQVMGEKVVIEYDKATTPIMIFTENNKNIYTLVCLVNRKKSDAANKKKAEESAKGTEAKKAGAKETTNDKNDETEK